MNISNLVFFDKNGESYNLNFNSAGYWEGADYFLPISTALFDCSNLFILEQTSPGVYKFPTMEEGSRFELRWTTMDFSDNLYLFTISQEEVGPEIVSFINKQDSITVYRSDFTQPSGDLDLTYPMQVNIAFNPTEERGYLRVLQIHYVNNSGSTKVLEMSFYGEGEGEDERLRVWINNFGIKFNREDALLLKDYDLKESLPDWSQINVARKNLLVNIDQVYPYVGTYKGLTNLINVLGYRDVLRVKEYWQDQDPNSLYYQKFAQVDITDLMNVGDETQIDFVDENGQIKKGGKFKKTEFLALAYEFTVDSGDTDEDGLPIVVETTEFSVNEIFFKLHGIARKLKDEMLPINVLIRDVIGEFIYFDKFNLRDWPDDTHVESSTLSDEYEVRILSPNTSSLELVIRDIKALYPKLNGTSAFPDITFNLGQVYPYQDEQKYDSTQAPYLIDAIYGYYDEIVHYDFYHIGEVSPIDNGDDTLPNIGCPVVLEAYVQDLMLGQLDGITFGDFVLSDATTSSTGNSVGTGTKYFTCATVQSFVVGSRVKITVSVDQSSYMIGDVVEINPFSFAPNTIKVNVDTSAGAAYSTGWTVNLVDTHFTIGNLKYKNGYEIEWIIEGPNSYYFQWRDVVANLATIPHVLPYSGEYTVTMNVHDMHGGYSTAIRHIYVSPQEPVIQAFIKIQDKSNYTIGNLNNLTISDLSNSPLYLPFANVININGENAPVDNVYAHYLDWFTYSHHYGVGSPQGDAIAMEDPLGKFELCWGTGSGMGQPTIGDYSEATISDLRFSRFGEMGYTGDKIDGFYIDLMNLDPLCPASYISGMQFGGFAEVDFFSLIQTPEDLLSFLESTTLPGWKEYRYELFGDRLKGTAKIQDKKNHSILKFIYTLSGIFGVSTYIPSSADLDISTLNIQLGTLTLFQSLMVGPSGPFWAGPSGPFWYGPSGPFYETPSGFPYFIGPSGLFLPGPSGWPDPSSWPGPSDWPDAWIDLWPDPSNSLWPDPSGWSFPTIYSNTILSVGDRLRVRNASGGFAEGYVISMSDYDVVIEVDQVNQVGDFTEFDLAVVETVYTFGRPMDTVSTASLDEAQLTVAEAGYVIDEDLLFLSCPFTDQLISTRTHIGAPASDIRYWIDRGFVTYDDVLELQTGYLPSFYDQNSLNMEHVRATHSTILAPLHHPVFMIISNLASNMVTEWTLYRKDTLVAKVKSTSYFIWRFDEPGQYLLEVKSTDSRGNVSTTSTKVSVSAAVDVDSYQKFIEYQLDVRKQEMIHP